jgi:hypothetical protein
VGWVFIFISLPGPFVCLFFFSLFAIKRTVLCGQRGKEIKGGSHLMDRPDDDDDVGGYRWSKSPAFECVQELPLPLPPLKLFWGRSHRSLPRWRGNAPPVWKTSPSRKSNKTTKPNQIKQKEGRKVWPGVVKNG